MPPKDISRSDQRVARALGLKVPVYQYLRDALAQGEDPVWLRTADPRLAGMFPNAYGFELLLERLQAEEALERRRCNLHRALQGRDLPATVLHAVEEAVDEGDLEDLALVLEPSPPPEGWEPPEGEEQRAFVEALRADVGLSRDLRRLFRDKAVLCAELAEGSKVDTRLYRQFAGLREPLLSLDPARYLVLRRGERAHALRLHFEVPAAELRGVFDRSVQGYPPQERDPYLKLFLRFFEEERLPRYAQEARARLKRHAENLHLQQAWIHLENALDRGRHDGPVLGLCVLRGNKLMAALIDSRGELLRTTALPAKAEDLGDRILAFVGEERPGLLAVQSDSGTRNVTNRLTEALRVEGQRLRTAFVPVAVVKTMLREVARRPGETHLTHDERQALLLARLAWQPRAAAFHTPHIVRTYVSFRGEINSRRLEAFETTFLRHLLLERGVDLNEGGRDVLRLVPFLDAEGVIRERSTAPFRSLADFQARFDLEPRAWRAACCFLRVRRGDEPLDARPLHPVYYGALREALERSRQQAEATEGDSPAGSDGRPEAPAVPGLAAVLKEPALVRALAWEEVLSARGWRPAVVDLVRQALIRGGRRRRAPARSQQGARLEALEIGAVLRGRITALLPYGAFVDVGARREGLVHVSEMADQFVKDPAEVVQVGQEVTVRVLSIDVENQRFRLSMRTSTTAGESAAPDRGGAQRSMRPKARRAGARPVGGGERGGPGRRRRGDGRDRRREEDPGPDPRAREAAEEIDPTNPFYQFFTQNKDQLPFAREAVESSGEKDEEEAKEESEKPASDAD